jgi:molybdopterin synthase catalytic subunit
MPMVELTLKPIDASAILQRIVSPGAGATLLFLGTTREFTDGRRTLWLEYDCYPEMANAKLTELESEARRRWGLIDCTIVHRLGRVPIGDASVAVAVSASHRGEAFAAGQWLIDTLKTVVPIWKQEHWADGESEWVHPGVASGQTATPLPAPPTPKVSSNLSES